MLYLHSYDLVVNFLSDFPVAAESFGIILYEFPIAFRNCWTVWNDTIGFNTTMSRFYDGTMDNQIISNLIFNVYDIYLILIDSYQALYASDYYRIGEDISRLVSDVFLKNPSASDWSFSNSLVYTDILSNKNGLLVDTEETELLAQGLNRRDAERKRKSEKGILE